MRKASQPRHGQTFSLARGDVLLLYKDGWVEARNATGEDFGIEGVAQVLRASASSPAGISYQNLLDAVHAWTPVQQDAVTLVVVRQSGVNEHAAEWGNIARWRSLLQRASMGWQC